MHGHLGGRPPRVSLVAERQLALTLMAAAAGALLDAAHDLSDGGLAVALAESCLRGGLGCRVRLPGDPFVWLFSESAARAVVAVRPGAEASFAQLCADHGVPATVLGTLGGDEPGRRGMLRHPAGRAVRRARAHPARPLRLTPSRSKLPPQCHPARDVLDH